MTKIITNLHNPLCKYFNMINNKTEIKELDLETGYAYLACGCLISINQLLLSKWGVK